MSLDEELQKQKIGWGRSAEVYKGVDSQGKPIARKIFTGSWVTKLANYFFLGAPNAYIQNEHAVQASAYRREIISELVEYWFGPKFRIAKPVGFRWNEQFKTYELQTEFIDGRHASLHHPFSQQREAELSDLVNNVMKPLQEKLIEAGLDGLVWQAGKGIPNASANFMLENNIYGENRWVCIDLESSVPAMLPLNIFTFFSFYLPKSIKHRRPLFDDVDIAKLRKYVGTKINRIPYATKKFIKEFYHSTRMGGIEGGLFYAILEVLEIKHMMALIVGTFPAGGNAAYPTQMAYLGSTLDRDIGAFGLYRIFSRIGEKIPLYGGRDTRTEHFFNLVTDLNN